MITLTTDFGTQDHYVAVMKGVIAQIAPKAQVVDVSHDIDPQNLLRAAFILRQTLPWFPPGTVHVVVVDPGVGSRRRILAARYAAQIVLVPDNGILSLVHRDLRPEDVRVVDNPRYFLPMVSATFHGRDIFAPVAAHLANGLPLDRIGPVTDTAEVFPAIKPGVSSQHVVSGQIVYVDRFGNLITNITRQDVVPAYKHRLDVAVYLGDERIGPIRSSYYEVPPGEALALMGSSETIEISINRGNAAQRFAAAPGAIVEVR